MTELPYYRLELDDYSAAAFTSFSKEYFGTMDDIRDFISALEQNEDFCKSQRALIEVFHKYQQGEKNIRHKVAYQEVPFLVRVKVLHQECRQYHDLSWEHLNTWRWPYYLRCSRADAEHLWLQCQKKYYRCVKVRFTGLEYESFQDEWNPLGGMLWSYPKMIEYVKPLLWNRLAVIEKYFDNLEDIAADIKAFAEKPDPDFSRFCDDIFGDG